MTQIILNLSGAEYSNFLKKLSNDVLTPVFTDEFIRKSERLSLPYFVKDKFKLNILVANALKINCRFFKTQLDKRLIRVRGYTCL